MSTIETAITKQLTNSTGILLACSIPVFTAAKKYVQDGLTNYNTEAKAEIQAIIKAYIKYCYPSESKTKALSTLVLEGGDKETQLPIFFAMEADDEKPQFYKQFKPNKELLDWLDYLNGRSPLRHALEEALGYICEYQNERDKRFWNKQRGYNYDPTNLFFEELKYWLVALSKAPLNENTLEVVKGRIDYLDYIDHYEVFKPGDYQPTRIATVNYVNTILKSVIQKTIQIAIYRENSRDHFIQLQLNVEATIKNVLRYLFYVFNDTDQKKLPKNFLLDELRKASSENYSQILNTISGKLLHHLVNTPVVLLVFPRANKEYTNDKNETVLTNETILQYDFIDPSGKLILPLKKDSLTINNWYLLKDNSNYRVGILPYFRQEKLMTSFLKLHSLVQKICIFHQICHLLVDLAGAGGDIFVYGYAVEKVEAVVNAYSELFKELNEHITILDNAAETLRNMVNTPPLINGKKFQPTDEDKLWKSRFKYHRSAKKRINEEYQVFSDIYHKVNRKIEMVHNETYLEIVKKKLEFFLNLTDSFTYNLHNKQTNTERTQLFNTMNVKDGIHHHENDAEAQDRGKSNHWSPKHFKQSSKNLPTPTPTLILKYEIPTNSAQILSVIELSSNRLLVNTLPNNISIWDWQDTIKLWQPTHELPVTQSKISAIAKINEKSFVLSSEDGSLTLFEYKEQWQKFILPSKHPKAIKEIIVAEDGSWMATRSEKEEGGWFTAAIKAMICVWDLKKNIIKEILVPDENSIDYRALEIFNGGWLVIGCDEGLNRFKTFTYNINSGGKSVTIPVNPLLLLLKPEKYSFKLLMMKDKQLSIISFLNSYAVSNMYILTIEEGDIKFGFKLEGSGPQMSHLNKFSESYILMLIDGYPGKNKDEYGKALGLFNVNDGSVKVLFSFFDKDKHINDIKLLSNGDILIAWSTGQLSFYKLDDNSLSIAPASGFVDSSLADKSEEAPLMKRL